MKILIIEDDIKIINFLQKGLKEEGYTIDYSLNGDEGIYLATVHDYDLILLDVMLPLKNGIEVCQTLRASKILTPVIMLTAKDSTEDKIKGLDSGANDYLAKPFSFSELLARIRVQLRTPKSAASTMKIGDLELNLLTKYATRGDDVIPLTAKEFSILKFLMQHENSILSETRISSSLSNINEENLSNTINVYIYRLRNKIDKPYEQKLIKTIRGLGFKISND